MTSADTTEPCRWSDAVLAAALFAADPNGIGGVSLRSRPGPGRERWFALLQGMLPPATPLRRLPLNVSDSRLLGGLDLAATLRAGRPVAERGLLIDADGGVVVVAMAERVPQGTAARLAAVLDTSEVVVERDGIAARHPVKLGLIALDEGIDDERPPDALRDRLAIHIDLGGTRPTGETAAPATADDIVAARIRLSAVAADDEIVTALCEAALALGIVSLRAPLLALRVARGSAALSGRDVIGPDDIAAAARLVLAPRAMQLPVQEQPDDEEAGDHERDETEPSSGHEQPDNGEPNSEQSLGDIVLAAAHAAVPADVLARLKLVDAGRSRPASSGRAGIVRQSLRRGRPIGSRRGDLRGGARLSVIDTLRAAVPWQSIRRREREIAGVVAGRSVRVEVRREDFHVARFKQRTETTTVFVVDASGSAAVNRLAEAKGAVEYLLADCYVRRDRVALISFRGPGAELLLPPTRSLVRAKRGLAGLPGGGGTPLAAGIDAACGLADALLRRGETPTVLLLTDGRANIARDGTAGRPQAEDDALAAARLLRLDGINALLIDTSPRPQPFAQRLATEMGAAYLVLPYADAAAVSNVVRASTEARRPSAARR
jgi:magnesium chelatase subunit D